MSEIFPVNSRVVGYCRDSGGANQDLSTRQQREQIGKWSAEQGLILSRVFEDAARSGASTVGRAAFLEMIDYLSGNVQEKGIILWEFARLSRDYDDLMYYVSDLKRQGFIVHSISDSVPEGLEGSLMLGVKAYANAKYLQDLRRNVKRGLHYVVRTYHAHTAPVPIGYKAERVELDSLRRNGEPHIITRLIVNEDTAPIVKKAFTLRALGATYKEINERLHIFSVFTSYEKFFKNMAYIGVRDYGGERVENYCPPLVTLDVWSAVQRLQDARAARIGYDHPRVVRSRFWLTGVLHCANCGRPMHANSSIKKNGREFAYYRCAGWESSTPCNVGVIPKLEIEGRTLEALRVIVLDKSILSEVCERSRMQNKAQDNVRNSQIATIQQLVANNEIQIDHILKAIKEAGHSHILLEELARLEKQQAELKQQAAQSEVIPIVVPISLEEITANIQAALDIADEKQRGIIARGLLARVDGMRTNRQLTGKITIKLSNMGEVEFIL